jgi:hypothetical protein
MYFERLNLLYSLTVMMSTFRFFTIDCLRVGVSFLEKNVHVVSLKKLFLQTATKSFRFIFISTCQTKLIPFALISKRIIIKIV